MTINVWTEYPTDDKLGIQDTLTLTKRTHLKLFGVTISRSRYARPVPSKSGAPVGITRSFWIWTKRRAWGYGTVVEWAKLQNLEVQIGSMAPIVSETGVWLFTPPYRVPGAFEIVIANRNAVDAVGTIVFWEWVNYGESIRVSEQKAIQMHFAVLRNARKLMACNPDKPRTLTRCECVTEALMSTARRARIYGRPEWLA